jgi:hypothetical protein
VDRRNKILLTNQTSGETISELLLVTDSPSDQGKQGEKKKTSSQLPCKLSKKKCSTLCHVAQNTNLKKKWGIETTTLFKMPIPGLDAKGISSELLLN